MAKQSNPPDIEIRRIEWESIDDAYKLPIALGAAYSDYQKRMDWLSTQVVKGLMDEAMALQIQLENFRHSVRLGKMHMEMQTRSEIPRYNVLSRIRGIKKIPGEEPQPIPQNPGDQFFALQQSAFAPSTDLANEYGSVFSTLKKYCLRNLVRVKLASGGEVYLPKWLVALKHNVLTSLRDLERVKHHAWFTQQDQINEERRNLRERATREEIEMVNELLQDKKKYIFTKILDGSQRNMELSAEVSS